MHSAMSNAAADFGYRYDADEGTVLAEFIQPSQDAALPCHSSAETMTLVLLFRVIVCGVDYALDDFGKPRATVQLFSSCGCQRLQPSSAPLRPYRRLLLRVAVHVKHLDGEYQSRAARRFDQASGAD